MAEFEGLDYSFYKMDELNLLCVPHRHWDRKALYLIDEPLVFDGTPATTAEVPQNPALLWDLALASQRNGDWGHSIDLLRQLRGLGQDEAEVSRWIAICSDYAGLPDEGLRELASIENRASLNASMKEQLHLVESTLLLRAGRQSEAALARDAAHGEVFMRSVFEPRGLPLEKHHAGQPLAGKHLLVVAYGGIGDIVQYARYLHALRLEGCASIVALVPMAVAGCLAHNFPFVQFIDNENERYDVSALAFDVWCTFLTLATSSGFDPQPFGMPDRLQGRQAYLECPPDAAREWRAWTDQAARTDGQAFRLGLNWRGVAATDAEFFRAASAADFAHLARLDGVQGFCLNHGIIAGEDASIIFPGSRIRDISDLAGLTSAMDAVITTCTAQVHIAGALGMPTILLLSPKADARWALGGHTDLYPGVRIVRARRVGRWEDAVDEAMGLLCAMRLGQGS